MTEAELRALGFTQAAGDRILHAPPTAHVTLTPFSTPTGDFYALRIELGRSGISVIVSKIAIKKDQQR